MLKITLHTSLTLLLFVGICGAQDKEAMKDKPTVEKEMTETQEKVEVTKNTTDMSEKTSPEKVEDMKNVKVEVVLQNTSEAENLISPEMKVLTDNRANLLTELNEADKAMKMLIAKSHQWDKERNTEKKGQLDTILDKADRLSFSNELRMKLSQQAEVISAIIKKVNMNEAKIAEQKIIDRKKREMDAYKKAIKELERERIALMAKLKAQENSEHVVHSTQAVQKKNEENVEYFTITEDTNLQTIALSYYQDHEKWVIIYEHPDNSKVLKQKDPTALIPIGTVLTIPKMTEE